MNNLAEHPDFQEVLVDHRRRLAGQGRQSGDYFVVPGIPYDGWKLDR